jgi:hypothetical protein
MENTFGTALFEAAGPVPTLAESGPITRGVGGSPDGLRSSESSSGKGSVLMSPNDEWSPDEPLDTEVFEQGDEAIGEASRIDPNLVEDVEQDPSLNPTLQVDERELEEAGAEFDDPERMVTLDGGMDDPDGLDEPMRSRGRDEGEAGWGLDSPLAGEADPDL